MITELDENQWIRIPSGQEAEHLLIIFFAHRIRISFLFVIELTLFIWCQILVRNVFIPIHHIYCKGLIILIKHSIGIILIAPFRNLIPFLFVIELISFIRCQMFWLYRNVHFTDILVPEDDPGAVSPGVKVQSHRPDRPIIPTQILLNMVGHRCKPDI